MELFNKMINNKPQKSDIVIFDETNSHYITEYILSGIPSFTYNMRPAKIYISFSLIYYFFRSLRFIEWQSIKTKKRKLHAIGKELLCRYHLSCFQIMNPKVVITFIDNSSIYHWLCQHYNEAKFIAIQNGHRTNWEIQSTEHKHYHQYFFCFGNYDKDRYANLGHHVEQPYPMGSLLGGYYKYKNNELSNVIYDIAIVSQYTRTSNRPSNKRNTSFNYFDIMNKYIAKYLLEYELKAVILLRSIDPKLLVEEKNYFVRIYNSNVKFIYRNKNIFSSYQYAGKSEIILGFNSTFLAEAFGLGRKVLRVDFSETNKYNIFDPMIMFTEPNYDVFKRRLNELRSEPYQEYRKRTKQYASYLMNYNPGCPPHIYIRQTIEKFL